jgi:glycosyltransferase involved in cell wall biosynthesis
VSGAPLVSVVVPAFQAERFVADAVGSVLAQSWPRLEVIVVDDGSTDRTAAIVDRLAVEDPRVRPLHQANAGLPGARNAGLAVARGSYVAFLDADDRIAPDKLERQLAVLEEAPVAGLVYGDHRAVRDPDGAVFDVPRGPPPLPFRALLTIRNWFAPFVPLLRRSLVERVGDFDEGFRAAEDWDYWYRCAQLTTFVYLPGVVGDYRLHAGQMHRDRARMAAAHRRFAAKHLADDAARRRDCLASLHLQQAKGAYGAGERFACARELAAFVVQAGGPGRARRVWSLL